MLEWIKDQAHFDEVRGRSADFLIIFFWGKFSEAARRALGEVEQFARDYPDLPVCAVDVEKVKSIHREYGVRSVPTVLVLKDNKTAGLVEGVQSAAFYETQLAGAAPSRYARPAKKKTRRVTVYTGPGCPACATVKAYLRQNKVAFREVDIGRDQQTAEKVFRRSGQRAVPQTEINGRLVVGFDKSRLDGLLGIQTERRE
jgi:glutaredoxin-like YruB-family protein